MIRDSDEPGTALPPPRFGLAAMMLAVSALAIMFAMVHYVGMLGSTIAFFFALCVLAHVAGNAIGTRLRDVGSKGSQLADESGPERRPRLVDSSEFAPVTRLRERYSLGKRNLVITIGGAVLGGTLGGLGLRWLSGPDAPWLIIVLGFSTSAVLAGIWTFAAASFIQVMLGAWFHASKDSAKR